MKHLKKLLSVLIALCLLGSLCTVAMAELTLEGNYDVTLAVGTNRFTVSDANTISVMEFTAGESGVFRFTLSGNAKLYTVDGSMFYMFNAQEVASKTFDKEIKESFANSPMLIGVAGNGTVSLTIERVDDAGFDVNALPYETYETTATLKKFTKPANTVLTYVDVSNPHSAVLGDDGNYHLDSADGPMLYIDLANAPYVSISAAASNGNMKVTLYNPDGSFYKKEEYITCINEYYGYTNNQTGLWVNGYTDNGIYPLTYDMVYIMQTFTQVYGWNDSASPNYLFMGSNEQKLPVDKDSAWMFPLCYDAELLPGGSKNPIQIYGDEQITVDAGSSVYVTVNGKNDLILTVSGTTGFTVDGAADTNGSFSVEVNGDPVTYILKNTTSTAQSYALSFGIPVGDPANPEAIPGAGNYTVTLEQGDTDGYTYNYIPTDEGYITIDSSALYAINGTISEVNPTKVDVVPGEPVEITVYGEGATVNWSLDVHAHVWADASCLTPATCACGATKGEPAPHDYVTGEGICHGVNLAEGEECGDNVRIPLMSEENTLTVPAGTTNYYEGYFNGMNATLIGNDVTIAHNGNTYPVTGSVTFKAVSANPRFPSVFAVTNTGSEEANYTLNFKYADGTFMAPELLTEGGNYTATIGADATDGYYYSYTATADCTVTVTINETTGWQYALSGSAGQGEGMHWCDDDPVVSSEAVELVLGDTLTVIIATYDPENPWSYPADSIDWTLDVHTHTWSAETCANDTTCSDCDVTKPAPAHNYQNGICSVCGDDIRIRLLETDNEITVPAGETAYYIGFYQGMNTTLTGNNVTITHNGETYTVTDSVTFPTAGDVKNPSLFVITNTGDVDATYRLSMVYPLGAKGNPEVMPEEGTYTATFAEGDEGYYYSFTAPADGKVTVTVNTDGDWQYSVSNPDGYYYGDIHRSDEDPTVPSEAVTVSKGHIVEIMISTYDPTNTNTSPAGSVSVSVAFEEGVADDNGSSSDDNGSSSDDNGSSSDNNGSGSDDNGSGSGNNGSSDDNGGSSDNNGSSGNNGDSDDNGGKNPVAPSLGIDLNGDGKSDFPINSEMLIPVGDKMGVDLNGDGVVDAMMIDLDRDGIFDGIDINFDGTVDLIILAEAPATDNNTGGSNSNGSSAPGGVTGVGNGESTSPQTGDEVAVLPFILIILTGAVCVATRKKQHA